MRAIICDTCGKSVPDTIDADILCLTISYSKIHEDAKFIERDICPVCMAKLVGFFEAPEPAAEAIQTPVEALEPMREPMPEPEVIEAPVEAPVAADPVPVVEEPVHERVLFAQNTFSRGTGKSTNKVNGKLLCANCNKPFVPKNALAKCCSKECGAQKWYQENKLKKAATAESVKKESTDELLARLKKENPAPVKEPVFSREL